MKTISADEFKKKYGEVGYNQMVKNKPATVQEKGYLGRAVEQFSQGAQRIIQGIKTGAKGFSSAMEEVKSGESFTAPFKATGALLRSGTRTAGTVAETAFAPITEAPGIKQGVEAIGKGVAQIPGVEKLSQLAQKYPEAARDIEDVVNLITLGGGKAIEKPLATGISETRKGIQREVSATAGDIKAFGQQQAKNLRTKNLRLSPVQVEKLGPQRVDDIVNYLSENKIKGSPQRQFESVSSNLDKMEKTVQQAITNSGKVYSKPEIIQAINDLTVKYRDAFDNPEVYEQLVRKSEQLVNYVQKNIDGDIPAARLNSFKRSYAKNGYNKGGDAVSNEASLAISDALYTKLLEDIPTLRNLNKEYQRVILTKRVLGKALGRSEMGLMGNIIATTAATITGGALGGPTGAAIGAASGQTIGRTLAGTAARTNAAQAIERITKP